MTEAILPGQTIGILGGGQLGRMLAMVARRSGYRVHVLTPEEDSPASHFANEVTIASDYDMDVWRKFSESVDVVTYEFENVPADPVRMISEIVPVRPGLNVLQTCQNRILEKSFLAECNIALADFSNINAADDTERAWQKLLAPAVLKTAGGGYDGKGQAVVRSLEELRKAWVQLGLQACTLERLVDLECEVSVIVARDVFGDTVTYGPIRNQHADHILDISSCPANLESRQEQQAQTMAIEIARQLDLTGLVCVEFFVTRDGEVLVNEIAPRPHNSGHLTIEAFSCSQFEQQLRTVCGLPVAPATQVRPAAMVNLLGDVWSNGEPDWARLAETPSCYLHLYDKSDPRPGRKMGHITVCAETIDQAVQNAVRARESLCRHPSMVPPANVS